MCSGHRTLSGTGEKEPNFKHIAKPNRLDPIIGFSSKCHYSPSKAPDSQNHLDSWLGKSKKDRPWVIEESNILALSVRKGKWKYIEPSNGSPMITWGPKIETGYAPYDQLFDMNKSEFESENLAPKYPAIVKRNERLLLVQERAKGKK